MECLGTQDFYHVMIPVKDINSPVKGASTMMRVPMMLPHELLGYLMDSEALFIDIFYIDIGVFFTTGFGSL